ncbi:transferase [Trypanosoma rangeli]|uniref:Transferase n=1 Tax=Trypanosoma rangeli TaxID=5698 RepID=A0A3R7LDU4_TRYRA|nr:transferase [Trypanosoma rangeli]RNF12429.1 transferase [Trypanosoma rangeli]|eukprot:RNF12429.1 transferase [Trypanosoma rangeli]
MHAGHPNGFFLYDDNHPGQYLLKKDGNGFYTVRLIDIDTFQKGTTVPLASPRYPYSNVSSHCRCFYCHGRSNCMFFNTYEAYEACGQVHSREAWGNEMPLMVRPGRLCDGSSDMWFEAQLLFFLFDGTVAWRALNHDELLHQINSGRVPPLTNSLGATQHSEAMRQLLSRMFLLRPTETAVLLELRKLCMAVGGCSQLAECPATVPLSAGSRYSSPLNLHLSR